MREMMRELAASEHAILASSERRKEDSREAVKEASEANDPIPQVEWLVRQAGASVSKQARELDEIRQGLELQLRHRDELLRRKNSALRGLEKEFCARVRELEDRVAALLKELEAK